MLCGSERTPSLYPDRYDSLPETDEASFPAFVIYLCIILPSEFPNGSARSYLTIPAPYHAGSTGICYSDGQDPAFAADSLQEGTVSVAARVSICISPQVFRIKG